MVFSLVPLLAFSPSPTGHLVAGTVQVQKGFVVVQDAYLKTKLRVTAGDSATVRTGDLVCLFHHGKAFIQHRDNQREPLKTGHWIKVARHLTERDRRLAELRRSLYVAARSKGEGAYPKPQSLVPASLLVIRLQQPHKGKLINVSLFDGEGMVVYSEQVTNRDYLNLPKLQLAARKLRDTGASYAEVRVTGSSVPHRLPFQLMSREQEQRLWTGLMMPPVELDSELAHLERRLRIATFKIGNETPLVDLAAAMD